MYKLIFVIFVVLSSMNVVARQDYIELRSQCANIETKLDQHLCERLFAIERERSQCTDSETDCDEQELGHLLALYWATQMIR